MGRPKDCQHRRTMLRRADETYIGALASMRPPMGVKVVLLGKHLGAPGKVAGEALPLCLATASLNLQG
jgi:hypothetical protein